MVEGVCGRGHAWQGACMAGKMAIAAGGTHPTRMHSCFLGFLKTRLVIVRFSLSFFQLFEDCWM